MSWADDIRCLYCDGRLPLYRKITNGQFCSAAHRKSYWQEQERLAVERLHQTHDSLRAYKPRGPVEAILGKTEPAVEIVSEPNVERPAWLTLSNSDNVPTAAFVEPVRVPARWLADRLLISDIDLLPATIVPRTVGGWFQIGDATLAGASLVALPFFMPAAALAKILAPGVCATHFTIIPVRSVPLLAAPLTEPVEIVEAPAPLLERLFALCRIACVAGDWNTGSRELEPLALVFRTHLPLYAELVSETLAPAALLRDERLRGLRMDQVAPAQGPVSDNLRALDLHASFSAPQFTLSTPPVRPRLRLAAGRRYAVETPDPLIASLTAGESAQRIEPPAMDISLPERQRKAVKPATPVFEPAAAGLVHLECSAQPSESDMRPAPAVMTLPQPPSTEPIRPASRLEPMVVDFMSHPPVAAAAMAMAMGDEPHGKRANVWTHSIDFWKRAPRDLKMLAIAIPLLLGLALHPALPKVRVSAPAAAGGIQREVTKAVNVKWANVKQSVFDRAGVALDEDFRSGLDEWTSRGEHATEWSFDATGFVQPGALALYRPSMNLTDYQVQFLGMIDKKALSWVVRAADFDNYYVVKLEVLKPGPLPTIGVTRYAVVNGVADSRADVVAPVDARNDMLYRVRLDVRGDEFSLSLQGQMIDAWSEPRLARGGIGFFSARGEASRLRWVQVTHQYDMLGRLCAYLAPYNIPSTTGSWQP
jgi:hypothetical protein